MCLYKFKVNKFQLAFTFWTFSIKLFCHLISSPYEQKPYSQDTKLNKNLLYTGLNRHNTSHSSLTLFTSTPEVLSIKEARSKMVSVLLCFPQQCHKISTMRNNNCSAHFDKILSEVLVKMIYMKKKSRWKYQMPFIVIQIVHVRAMEVSLRWFGHISGFRDPQFKDVSALLCSCVSIIWESDECFIAVEMKVSRITCL